MMEKVIGFLNEFFFYIWLVIAVVIISLSIFRGYRALKSLGKLDMNHTFFNQKYASGYSKYAGKGMFLGKFAGANKCLHIIITDKELIIKTFLIFASFAQHYDMLHKIQLVEIVKTKIERDWLLRKTLLVRFKTKKGDFKEIVLISKHISQIKEILDKKGNNEGGSVLNE